MKFLDTALKVKGKYIGLSFKDGDRLARRQNGKKSSGLSLQL
jgi:hypothetical protein